MFQSHIEKNQVYDDSSIVVISFNRYEQVAFPLNVSPLFRVSF